MRRLLTPLALAALAAASAQAATPDPCTQHELTMVGKTAYRSLVCYSKEAGTGISSGLAPCSASAEAKLVRAFDRYHDPFTSYGCFEDDVSCKKKVEVCATSVAGAFVDAFPSHCESAKRKAAAKLARSEIACYAAAGAKEVPVDPSCIAKATAKFSAAIANAGACPDGGTPLALVEDACVRGAVVADPGGVVTQMCPTCLFVAKWGTAGTAAGQFDQPYGVAVDVDGTVYVADSGNDRIQKFTNTGTFLGSWGTTGTGDGEFDLPHGVGVDGSGNVYVADSGNDRIQKFATDGTFITKWGTRGGGAGELAAPQGVATSGGAVYVADGGNHRIQKFASDGTFLLQWSSFTMRRPLAVAVDGAGDVWVADENANVLLKFTSTGGGLASHFVLAPEGVAVDPTGNVYASGEFQRIIEFTMGGARYRTGRAGSADGQLLRPQQIAIDGDGYVYVVDRDNSRIQKFICPY